VKYEATGDWYLKEVHLYVLGYEPTERLTPGLAPFKSGDLSYAKDCTFTLPLNEFEEVVCGETALWLQAHASAVKILNNEVVQEETAYACDINTEANPWYGNAMYTVQCCQDVPPPCYEFTGETAWGAGTRYVSKGNWATYTPYVPGSTANLYAGQTMNAGTVTFSPVVNSKVTITINLTDDWEFAQVEENVKIQDYATAPSTKPSPGRFRWKNTASGKSFSIDVPANSDYGVHADVGYWKEVQCPLD
jgi:hypothetical protein